MIKDAENIVHHYHHHDAEDKGFNREITINGSIYSISISSNDPDENMDYLAKKSMNILKELIRENYK